MPRSRLIMSRKAANKMEMVSHSTCCFKAADMTKNNQVITVQTLERAGEEWRRHLRFEGSETASWCKILRKYLNFSS